MYNITFSSSSFLQAIEIIKTKIDIIEITQSITIYIIDCSGQEDFKTLFDLIKVKAKRLWKLKIFGKAEKIEKMTIPHFTTELVIESNSSIQKLHLEFNVLCDYSIKINKDLYSLCLMSTDISSIDMKSDCKIKIEKMKVLTGIFYCAPIKEMTVKDFKGKARLIKVNGNVVLLSKEQLDKRLIPLAPICI